MDNSQLKAYLMAKLPELTGQQIDKIINILNEDRSDM